MARSKESLGRLNTALTVAHHALRISTLDYTGQEIPIRVIATDEIKHLYHLKTNFDCALKKVTFSTEFHQQYTLGDCTGDAYGNLHLGWDGGSCWIVTHSHIVAVRDMINRWFDGLLYGLCNRQKYPGYDLYQEVSQVIHAGQDLLHVHGQGAYELLKLWPSLTISSILRDTEQKTDFYDAVTDDLACFKTSIFYKLATRPFINDIIVQLGLELTEMWKCFGHPDINMDLSVATWIHKGAAGKEPCPQIAKLLTWAFRLEFCRQFYKQRRRWPIIHIKAGTPDKIKKNYQNNLWDEKPSSPWTPEDFQNVLLDRNLDFDYHIDTSDLLSDKSIIPGKSQWIHEFDKQAHRTLHGFFPTGPSPTFKSAVIHYLQLENISVKDVLDILQSGNIPDEWRVMVAVPKEREFKFINARFYGKMCFEMRLYQTVTEKNIADHVFPFVKHQSMTMNEEQLTRMNLRINTPTIELEGETYVFIVLDFSSWCTNFRHELVTPLFTELDRLFGLHNVYSFTHLFPQLSTLLFQDRFNPPRQGTSGAPLNGPRCFTGPEAWLEGLRQKGWTLATIMIILIASWRCGTSASLLGQGDNQVILFRVPPHEYLATRSLTRDQYINEYLVELQRLCNEAQIVVKLEETWYSRHLFEYSRKYHYKGIQVSGCLKRITRLSSEANQVIPSLHTDLAGIFSTGATAASEDGTPRASYFCTIVEACLRLWDSYPDLGTEPWEKTCCLMLTTRCLGGYPITTYSQFCTRAVQDTLSTNLHLVKTVAKDPILAKYIGQTITLQSGSHKDFLSLIKDPQSLPLDIPVQPDNYIR